MHFTHGKFNDKLYTKGLYYLAACLVIFCMQILFEKDKNHISFFFLLNFTLTVVYFFEKLSNGSKSDDDLRIHYQFILLLLLLVSAYSLNRGVSALENSASWFSVLLVALGINYIAFAFFEDVPEWGRYAMSFINGTAFLTFAYLSFCLMPLYIIGVAGFFLLGFSLLVFVPFVVSIYTVLLQSRIGGLNKYWISFIVGLFIPIVFIGVYSVKWRISSVRLMELWNESYSQNIDEPDWVYIAKGISDDEMACNVLKSEIVYSVPEWGETISLFSWTAKKPSAIVRVHDPLIMISGFFSGKSKIPRKLRIDILNAVHDIREGKEPRRWSSERLEAGVSIPDKKPAHLTNIQTDK